MKHQTISLCMIVKNEERSIERCLNSVKDVVDEIIIVDTGSTDRTIDLIQAIEHSNLKLSHYEWINDFADARNFAIQQATGDYILQMDADEYVDHTKAQLLDKLDKECYLLRIRNDFGSGLAEYHYFYRMFRNNLGLRYVGALHEQIDTTGLTRGKLNVILHHDGYLPQIIEKKNKSDRNMKIILQELEDHPTAFNYYNLGLQYNLEKQYPEAIEAFKKSFQLGYNYTFSSKMMVTLAKCLMELKQYTEALSILDDSNQIFGEHKDFYYYKGLIYETMGYLRDAEASFLKCLELGEEQDSMLFLNGVEGTGSYLAMARLGEIYIVENRKDEALQFIVQGIQLNPSCTPLIAPLLQILTNLPRDTFFEQLFQIWPINQVEHIKSLSTALFQLRHPMLISFMECFSLNFSEEAKIYVDIAMKNYEAALQTCLSMEQPLPEQVRDWIYLAMVTSNEELLRKCRGQLNWRDKEFKLWNQLVARKELKCVDLSDSAETMENLIHDLLQQQEFGIIDQLLSQYNDPGFKYICAKLFMKFGFKELALEILEDSEDLNLRESIYILTADILHELGNLGDAYYYYKQAYSIRNQFGTAYKILSLSQEAQDVESYNEWLNELRTLKPNSPWVDKEWSVLPQHVEYK